MITSEGHFEETAVHLRGLNRRSAPVYYTALIGQQDQEPDYGKSFKLKTFPTDRLASTRIASQPSKELLYATYSRLCM